MEQDSKINDVDSIEDHVKNDESLKKQKNEYSFFSIGGILTIVSYATLKTIFGLGGFIGGAIAGVIGFGLAEVIKIVLKSIKKTTEQANDDETKKEVIL